MTSLYSMISPLDDARSAARLLEQRLEDGYAMIEDRKVAGLDVTALEDFWIELLHQYEELCSGLDLAA